MDFLTKLIEYCKEGDFFRFEKNYRRFCRSKYSKKMIEKYSSLFFIISCVKNHPEIAKLICEYPFVSIRNTYVGDFFIFACAYDMTKIAKIIYKEFISKLINIDDLTYFDIIAQSFSCLLINHQYNFLLWIVKTFTTYIVNQDNDLDLKRTSLIKMFKILFYCNKFYSCDISTHAYYAEERIKCYYNKSVFDYIVGIELMKFHKEFESSIVEYGTYYDLQKSEENLVRCKYIDILNFIYDVCIHFDISINEFVYEFEECVDSASFIYDKRLSYESELLNYYMENIVFFCSKNPTYSFVVLKNYYGDNFRILITINGNPDIKKFMNIFDRYIYDQYIDGLNYEHKPLDAFNDLAFKLCLLMHSINETNYIRYQLNYLCSLFPEKYSYFEIRNKFIGFINGICCDKYFLKRLLEHVIEHEELFGQFKKAYKSEIMQKLFDMFVMKRRIVCLNGFFWGGLSSMFARHLFHPGSLKETLDLL